MPPSLALLLCTIFVLLLLRLEHKQGSSLSHSLWIPTIWFIYSSSKPLGTWLGVSGADMESGSPIDRAFLIALFLVGVLILSRRKFNWSNSIKENYWVMILLAYMLISIIWSDIPGISLKRWIREMIAVVMVLMILSEQNPRQALQSIIRRSIYILIPFSLLLVNYYPRYGIQYSGSGRRMWIGVSLHKNGLAQLCILAALFLIWTLVRRGRRRDILVNNYQVLAEVFLLFLTLWLLAGPERTLTYSATSTVALAVGLIALAGLFLIKKYGLALSVNTLKVMVVLIVAYGTFTPFAGKLRFLDISSALGREETLTGRNFIWSILVPLAMSRPIFGHGFGGFWTTEIRSLSSSHAHNGYLELLLGLGFVGLVLVSIFLLACCHRVRNSLAFDFDWGVLFICYLLMTLVHNIGEPSIDTFTSPLSAIILFFYFSSSMHGRGESVRSQPPTRDLS